MAHAEVARFGRLRSASLLIPHFNKHKEEARKARRISLTLSTSNSKHEDNRPGLNFMVSDSR